MPQPLPGALLLLELDHRPLPMADVVGLEPIGAEMEEITDELVEPVAPQPLAASPALALDVPCQPDE